MNKLVESALVVLIPEAEPLVDRFRRQYDPAAASGVPAHVTVLYPFLPVPQLAGETNAVLRELFSCFPSFQTCFRKIRRFPSILYLAPDPDHPFWELTQLVAARFPETPPYGGQFADPIPHLTVAQIEEAQLLDDIAQDLERAALDHFPIRSEVREIVLMDNQTGRWQVRTHFPLSPVVSRESGETL